MSGGYLGKFLQRQCKIHLPRDNLWEPNVLESAFFRLWKSLKSKILATMVPATGYTGFIMDLPFWATRRLERMIIICWLPSFPMSTWSEITSYNFLSSVFGVTFYCYLGSILYDSNSEYWYAPYRPKGQLGYLILLSATYVRHLSFLFCWTPILKQVVVLIDWHKDAGGFPYVSKINLQDNVLPLNSGLHSNSMS